MSELNYGRMMLRAMQGVVAEALSIVSEHGFEGDHHFYITFRTAHPGVDIPDWLRAQFPKEMVIVLQHEFYDLAVTEDRFSVQLSFGNRPAVLVVPFDAVLQFADPSTKFGLRFDNAAEEDDEEDVVDEDEDFDELFEQRTEAERRASAEAASASSEGDAIERKPADVVDLDAFRKK